MYNTIKSCKGLCHSICAITSSHTNIVHQILREINKLGIGKSWQHSTFVINCMNFVLRIMVLLLCKTIYFGRPTIKKYHTVEIWQKIWKKLCTNVCPTGAFITDAGTRNIYYGLRCLFLLLLFSISLFLALRSQ